MAHIVFIRGIPQVPDVAARNQPGVQGSTVLFRPTKETQATCSQVKIDPNGDNLNGQTYFWLFLTFSDGRTGWVRDDLLDLQGDCTSFGYGNYPTRVYAFTQQHTIVPSTPSAPAAPVTPPAAPTAPSTPATPPVPTTAGSCTAAVRSEIRAKVRSQPALVGPQIALLEPSTPVTIVASVNSSDGETFKWLHIKANNTVDGYLREDLLDYTGDCTSLNLTTNLATPPAPTQASQPTQPSQPSQPSQPVTTRGGLFAPPVQHYVIFQEFGGMAFGTPHKGTDFDIPVGTPITASAPGVVAYLLVCSKCTAAQPNFQSQGLQSWDSKGISDPAWGYGFGNAVVVRYAYSILPAQMRAAMDAQNVTNGYAYVIHAHMSRIDVQAGVAVQAGTQLGLSGTTGNSTGPHLHLEVHMITRSNVVSTYNTPVINARTMYQI